MFVFFYDFNSNNCGWFEFNFVGGFIFFFNMFFIYDEFNCFCYVSLEFDFGWFDSGNVFLGVGV